MPAHLHLCYRRSPHQGAQGHVGLATCLHDDWKDASRGAAAKSSKQATPAHASVQTVGLQPCHLARRRQWHRPSCRQRPSCCHGHGPAAGAVLCCAVLCRKACQQGGHPGLRGRHDARHHRTHNRTLAERNALARLCWGGGRPQRVVSVSRRQNQASVCSSTLKHAGTRLPAAAAFACTNKTHETLEAHRNPPQGPPTAAPAGRRTGAVVQPQTMPLCFSNTRAVCSPQGLPKAAPATQPHPRAAAATAPASPALRASCHVTGIGGRLDSRWARAAGCCRRASAAGAAATCPGKGEAGSAGWVLGALPVTEREWCSLAGALGAPSGAAAMCNVGWWAAGGWERVGWWRSCGVGVQDGRRRGRAGGVP